MKIYSNYSLKNLNTFKVDVLAKYYIEVESDNDLTTIISSPKYTGLKKYIIGDAANILFLNDFDGLILKNSIKGLKIIKNAKDYQVWEIGSGEDWSNIVEKSVNLGLGGIENMILIPGTVGAAPVQGIAAYGQNFADIFVSLDAVNLKTGNIKSFTKDECEFSYRESIFKNKLNNKYYITKVRIKLLKNPMLDISYFETGNTYKSNVSIVQELESFAKRPYTVSDISRAVKNIRTNKLPDLNRVGSAGSVFKNPLVTYAKYKELKIKDPDLQCYPQDKLKYAKLEDMEDEEYVKIPAGRLLDFIGWKGKRVGNVGTHPSHALAVVNYGASAEDVYSFILKMKDAVLNEYGIELEYELRLVK